MKIDFDKPSCQTLNILSPSFGIIDPQDKSPAYVSVSDEVDWVAVVENRSGLPLKFTAVDNCIDIYREDGQMDYRCDGILSGAGHLIFIELKDQRGEWIQHAVDHQLMTTVLHFVNNCDMSRYKKRYAYACNKRHPQFQYSHMSMMDDFRRKTGVRLCIVNKIVVK